MKMYINKKKFKRNLKFKLIEISLGAILTCETVGIINAISDKSEKQEINYEMDNFIEANNREFYMNFKKDIDNDAKIESKNTGNKKTQYYSYSVKAGDSLSYIAGLFGCSIKEIINKNNLTKDVIYKNQTLQIPITKKNNEHSIGIDVSEWNGTVNWDITQNYIDYAIIRICDFCNKDENGNYILDKKFKENIEKCNELDIPVGVYAYTRATNNGEALKEANFVLNAIKDYQVQYPVYYDIESSKHKEMLNSNPDKVINIVETFCKTIEKANYYVGIYTGDDMMQILTNNSKKLGEYDKWVARYGKNEASFIANVSEKDMKFSGQYYMQQATSAALVPGIDGKTDVNFSYVDFPTIIKNAGLNNLETSKKR